MLLGPEFTQSAPVASYGFHVKEKTSSTIVSAGSQGPRSASHPIPHTSLALKTGSPRCPQWVLRAGNGAESSSRPGKALSIGAAWSAKADLWNMQLFDP